jgi:hypothetical protein
MATYSGPFVSKRVDLVYKVPAGEPWGSTYVEIEKAYYGLKDQLRRLGALGETESPADDLIRVLPHDDEIWLVATVENYTDTATDEDLAGLSRLE